MSFLKDPIRKLASLALPLVMSFLIVVLLAGIDDIFNSLAHVIVFVLLTAFAYGIFRLDLLLHWQAREKEVRDQGCIGHGILNEYFLPALAGLLSLVGLLVMTTNSLIGSLVPFAAAASILPLVRARKRLDRKAEQLLLDVALHPPTIHQGLMAEIDAWTQTNALAGFPVIDEVGKLSSLMISEGMEDAGDRPLIEAFYAEKMTEVTADLATLRKLLLGQAFLTAGQQQEVEALKKKIELLKSEMLALYQRIVG